MLTIRYCEPFNGRLALSGVIGGWLLNYGKGERIFQLAKATGGCVDEMQLFEFIKANEPKWLALFALASIEESCGGGAS